MSPAQSSPVLSCSVQETSTCSWVSPLHLETGFCGNFCSPSCITAILTPVPHCFTTELGCVCCPGAACKAPGAPVPSAQPVCPQDREHCKDQTMQHWKSNGSYSKIPFTGQFTTQSSLHSDCHKHWLCPGSQKHLCGRFQKLNLHL